MISEVVFDQLEVPAQILEPELQQARVHLIQVAPYDAATDEQLFVDEILREAGAFEVASPLLDAHIHMAPVLEADLLAAVDWMATEWEEDPLL